MSHPGKVTIWTISGIVIACAAIVLLTIGLVVGQEQKEPMKVVGHRGLPMQAPENTLAGFEKAWEQGVEAIELDVSMTKDGQLVCIHDPNTFRTTGEDKEVMDSTLEELRKMEAGSFMDENYRGEKIPTLLEVLKTVPDEGIVYIDVKGDADSPEALPGIKRDIDEAGLKAKQIRFVLFEPAAVEAAKAVLPDVEAYLAVEQKEDKETGTWSPSAEELIAMLRACGADGVDINQSRAITSEYVKKVKDAGYSFHVWTVNSPHLAKKYEAMGVDSLTTDRAAFLNERLFGKKEEAGTMGEGMPSQMMDVQKEPAPGDAFGSEMSVPESDEMAFRRDEDKMAGEKAKDLPSGWGREAEGEVHKRQMDELKDAEIVR